MKKEQGPMSEMVKIEFYGQQVEAVKYDNDVWVSVKRICDNVGVDKVAQVRKIKDNHILTKGGALVAYPSGGGIQETFCLRLDLLPVWLFTIDPKRAKGVQEEVLELYQDKCVDAIRGVFFGKKNIVAELTPLEMQLQQLQAMALLTQGQIEQQKETLLIKKEVCLIKTGQEEIRQEQALALDVQKNILEKVEWQEQVRKEAVRKTKAMPAPNPEVELPGRTKRSLLNQLVSNIVGKYGLPYTFVWNFGYDELSRQHHIDIPLRAKNRKISKIEYLSQIGSFDKKFNTDNIMDQMYKLLWEKYPVEVDFEMVPFCRVPPPKGKSKLRLVGKDKKNGA